VNILTAGQPLCRSVTKSLSITEGVNPYIFEHKGSVYKLETPKHFLFDGASIPRLVWSILGLAPHGIMDGPGLPHDFIYQYRGVFPEGCYSIQAFDESWVPCTVPMPKATGDLLLRELVVYFRAAGRFKAFLIWSAVATFGGFAWRSDDVDRKGIILEHESLYHSYIDAMTDDAGDIR